MFSINEGLFAYSSTLSIISSEPLETFSETNYYINYYVL